MKGTFFLFFILIFGYSSSYGQSPILSYDSVLNRQIIESSLIHSPLPLNRDNSLEKIGLSKKVFLSDPITKFTNLDKCTHWGLGKISMPDSNKKYEDYIKLEFSNQTDKRAVGSKDDLDYATYGQSGVIYHLKGVNLEKYNRIAFSIYPNCKGARVVNMSLSFVNESIGNKSSSVSHYINLVNQEWNRCILEIDDYQRNKVLEIGYTATLRGKDRTTSDSSIYYIKDIKFETIGKPDKKSGWIPDEGKIIYSYSGYMPNSNKTAIINADILKEHRQFQIVEVGKDSVVFDGTIEIETTTLGKFGLINFSSLITPGQYRIRVGTIQTHPFIIDNRLWESSQWKMLNFIFSQRCGYPIPTIHSVCHQDLMSVHNGKKISYSGGWHDAGDLSQQTIQTGDVTFSLLEAYNKLRYKNPILASRLCEEAEWGLEFILKNRYGDGYRASSMGLLIWQDGLLNTIDDINSVRVQNNAFDNFVYSGYEAYASMTLDNDPMMQEYLKKIAEEDFSFAMDKFKKDGFDKFNQPYEHTYNTPKSQYMATISWAASQLYKLTNKKYYADVASETIEYTLSCQRIEPLKDKNETCGFFYRDEDKLSIVHYIHQSREQIYMQALVILCQTQPNNPNYSKWESSIKLYGNYIKGLMKYTSPYGMIPSGVYNSEEFKDSTGFYYLHLFPPTNAKELYLSQIKNGVKIDNSHYIRRFPIWFNIFNGNTAIHLSTGKSAAICGSFLNDKELQNIGLEQLYWTVGKNPFAQSLIYGEGYNYTQLNSFSSGEITGAIPVGIKSFNDYDIPYWPQTNNACYKEVWVTSAGKWLSLIAEY